MRKMMTALALGTLLAASAGGAQASTTVRMPALAAATPTTTPVQYYGGYGAYPEHRAWRHEMWRRHVMHERWRRWHAYRAGAYGGSYGY